ncbi:hypothetical protein A4G18_00560 [Pasteurellaceae bacterium Pebbles2]|nr:hypothetical protein [Pasteurellaceae bacterium Pebbles2]
MSNQIISNSFQVSNMFVDELLSLITDDALFVAMAIYRGNGADDIYKLMDVTGLPKCAVLLGVKELRRYGVIQ